MVGMFEMYAAVCRATGSNQGLRYVTGASEQQQLATSGHEATFEAPFRSTLTVWLSHVHAMGC